MRLRPAEIYRRTRKSPDLFWNWAVCRPIAALVLSGIHTTRVTPNQITLLSAGVAFGAAALLASAPGYVGLVAGALVLEASYVLDCADGMLARLRGIASDGGHLLDFLMDEIKAFVVLAAVSLRLYREHHDADLLALGLLGLVALATGTALTTFLRRPEIARPSTTPSAAERAHGIVAIAERVAKGIIHYPSYIWLAALFGRIELYFYPYIAVNALYAARAFATVAFRFAGASSAPKP
ncbi:MAG: CDP-alcohol phosphatidyltransferase family protein [Pseudomonadota bacterium]|nr:MAG: hypothetical protein DIU78_04215 [Pseudomonadota bacterium]